jgi:catechol 2,3-dioxygenase-like lactoylglutathione lyase family enzyme
MAITGILQIHISSPDVSAAVVFYRDILGLDLLFEVPEQSMAFFDLGGTRLYIGKPESPDFESAPLLYFRVSNIEAEYGRLLGHDVEFLSAPHKVHETDAYQLWLADFKTPDGHVNVLAEEKPI